MLLLPPRSPLFPYTTLFRSVRSPLRLRHVMRPIPESNRYADSGECFSSKMIPRFSIRLSVSALTSLVSWRGRSEEHTSELQSRRDLVCRLLLEKKKHMKDNI